MHHIDQGHKALDPISRTYGQLNLYDANEAETRLKVIDELLFRVLGWLPADVSVESRVSEDGQTSFADYIVATASTSFIVEAKRVGVAFGLPSRRAQLKLGGVLSEGPLGEAIRQVRDYCRKRSIPYAVVTNGNAWIIFPAVRMDGVPFEESEARVFRNLEDVKTRFVEFWELLSRERVMDGNLENEFSAARPAPNAQRILRNRLPEPGFRLGRNGLFEHIEPAVSQALSDEALLEDVEALSACYVKTSERLKFDTRLQMHLRDTLPQLGHQTTRVRSRKNQSRVEERLAGTGPKSPPRFIVVLGPVGAGKTTFLHYTRKVSAASSIQGKLIWVMVDFKRATTADSPRTFMMREILSHIETDEEFQLGDWQTTIRAAYGPQIDALRKGALFLLAKHDPNEFDKRVAETIVREREEVAPYVERILNYASTKWPGFLIIDNVDQLEDFSLQEAIFIEAQAIARRIGFSVIMCMRETSFLRHKDRPVFDAFQFESFYIDPPNVVPVLSHRFGYAKKVLAGKEVTLRAERGISLSVPDLSKFFDIVSHSLLDSDAGFMFECLSGGNVRRGLFLVREFLASGHTNADRALAAYLTEGDYKFPRHEVFKGAVLGSSKYFNDNLSLLPNLFDSKLDSISLQLLRLRFAHRLVSMANDGGGLSLQDTVNTLARMGISERETLETLDDLFRRGFVRTSEGLPPTPQSTLFPTRLAGFALQYLCRDFAYVEFCCLDSVIRDADAWEELLELTNEIESCPLMLDRLKLRTKRANRFFDYLMSAEERWIVDCNRRDISLEWSYPLLPEMKTALEANMREAVLSATRMAGRAVTAGRTTSTSIQATTDGQATIFGRLVNVWSEKDYVFIQDDDGVEWFGHRKDFNSEAHWRDRDRGRRCSFAIGSWNGKPRAVDVRVIT